MISKSIPVSPNKLPAIPVVYFHSVAPAKNPHWAWRFLTLELRFFEDFLRYLKHDHWETISLDEYLEMRKSGQKSKRKVCCLTFDDGYLDNYIYAWPLLKKYDFRATIFVSPDFVDYKRKPALTLDAVWSGKASLAEIDQWGLLSWEEMRIMEKSGAVDIQSHTLTHSKYFVSDQLAGFHHPHGDCLYPIGNLFPEKKPYYIGDRDFESSIPFGYPFFEQRSAAIARRVFINEEFNSMSCDLLKDFVWSQPNAIAEALKKTEDVFQQWRKEERIITRIESEEEYKKRISDEISLSKKLIETNLEKTVKFLCWPHGDNNEELHALALASGYAATTTGSKQKIAPAVNRIAQRTAVSVARNSLLLTRMKNRYRLGAAAGKRLFRAIHTFRERIG